MNGATLAVVRPQGVLGTLGVIALCAVAWLCADVATAAAQGPDGEGTDRFVTFVARECPTYTDIMANRARNDIQESLADLGEDSVYVAGEPIDPTIEATEDPSCTPIDDWTFTLGTGIRTRAVTGPWGSLSIVTNPYSTSIVTQPSVPLRDEAGRPVEGEPVEGAVTIELTPEQAARAAGSSSLWVQGGTTADPILDKQFPSTYGFGALRCSIDNLNGDNVEWISFPSGAEHVYCYAYYVKPPPTSGTITIRKQVAGVEGSTEQFAFGGNLSFNPGGVFNLKVTKGKAASQTFYRAAGLTWNVDELVPDGWRLTDLTCQKPGASQVTTDLAAGSASILLAAGDNVLCTFTDAPKPATGQLFLRKLSLGGVGTFGFDVGPVGAAPTDEATATTTTRGVPVDATPSPLELAPGSYRIEERLPRTRGGRWRLVDASCGGLPRSTTGGGVDVEIAAGEGASCTFTNLFVPRGSIEVAKETRGGVGTAAFVISPAADPTRIYEQSATTTAEEVPVLARGDRTRPVPLGEYVIQEIEPETVKGEWTLARVVCNGSPVPQTQGRVTIRLTPEQPRVRCVFGDQFRATPGPPAPPPDPPGPNVVPGAGSADLVLSKVADRATAGVGERVTYRVRVQNRGDGAAEEVWVADRPGRGLVPESVDSRCRQLRLLFYCRVGAIPAGGEAVLRFTMRIGPNAPATVRNVAAVGSDAAEARVRNNVAVEGVAAGKPVCGPARPIPRPGRAQAAC